MILSEFQELNLYAIGTAVLISALFTVLIALFSKR